jgi:hypothetical protein
MGGCLSSRTARAATEDEGALLKGEIEMHTLGAMDEFDVLPPEYSDMDVWVSKAEQEWERAMWGRGTDGVTEMFPGLFRLQKSSSWSYTYGAVSALTKTNGPTTEEEFTEAFVKMAVPKHYSSVKSDLCPDCPLAKRAAAAHAKLTAGASEP